MLPPRRKPQRSGILREVRREWPRHRAFLRRHQCCVPGCTFLPIEVAHVRSAGNSGVGLRPGDWSAVPLCHDHHREQHQIGLPAFEARYGIDLAALAVEFARRSPDARMKEALREAGN